MPRRDMTDAPGRGRTAPREEFSLTEVVQAAWAAAQEPDKIRRAAITSAMKSRLGVVCDANASEFALPDAVVRGGPSGLVNRVMSGASRVFPAASRSKAQHVRFGRRPRSRAEVGVWDFLTNWLEIADARILAECGRHHVRRLRRDLGDGESKTPTAVDLRVRRINFVASRLLVTSIITNDLMEDAGSPRDGCNIAQ